MSRTALLPVSADPPGDRSAAARALIERQVARLERLAEIGMGIAEAAGRRAEDGAAGAEAPDPALSFARAARAVRLTIALQARLMQDLMALDRGEALARAGEASRRRVRVHRLVERALEVTCDDEDEAERLADDAWERLSETEDEDLAERPVGEVVAWVCAALRLSAAARGAVGRLFAEGALPVAAADQPAARLRAAADAEIGGLLLSSRKARERAAGSPKQARPHPPPLGAPSPHGGGNRERVS